MCTETFQGKPTFYVAYVKNEKKNQYKISLFSTSFLSFLYRLRKISVLNETLREPVECGDLHANIFPKICFPDKGNICTSVKMAFLVQSEI
jgi:hypothetical protein